MKPTKSYDEAVSEGLAEWPTHELEEELVRRYNLTNSLEFSETLILKDLLTMILEELEGRD
jgi:hypothetical protein